MDFYPFEIFLKNVYCVSIVGLDEVKIRKYAKWQQEKESLG